MLSLSLLIQQWYVLMGTLQNVLYYHVVLNELIKYWMGTTDIQFEQNNSFDGALHPLFLSWSFPLQIPSSPPCKQFKYFERLKLTFQNYSLGRKNTLKFCNDKKEFGNSGENWRWHVSPEKYYHIKYNKYNA